MVSKILESTQEFSGGDIHARTLYELSSISTREPNSLLDLLYYYWSSLNAGQEGLPMAPAFQPESILPPATRHFTARIDVAHKDPLNFVVCKLVPGSFPGAGNQKIVTRLGELPNNLLINTLVLEYARCKQWRNPLYHEINQTIGGVKRNYSRVLLPLVDKTGSVIQLFYGFRQILGPTRFDLPS